MNKFNSKWQFTYATIACAPFSRETLEAGNYYGCSARRATPVSRPPWPNRKLYLAAAASVADTMAAGLNAFCRFRQWATSVDNATDIDRCEYMAERKKSGPNEKLWKEIKWHVLDEI